MATVREQYKAIMESSSPREFFSRIPWSLIEYLAATPVAFFFASVVYQLFVLIFAPYSYLFATKMVMRIALACGGSAAFLYAGKKSVEHVSPVRWFRSHLPVLFFDLVMLLMLLSTCINGFTKYAMKGDAYRGESLYTYLMYFAAYYCITSFISRKTLKRLLLFLFLGCSLAVNLTTLYVTFVQHKYDFWNEYLIGVYLQYNHYGYYLNLVVIVSSMLTVLEENKALKALSFVSFLVSAATLIINNTFGCILACFVALIFCVIAVSVVKRKFSWLSVAMFVIYLLIAIVVSTRFPSVLDKLTRFQQDVSSVAESVVASEENAEAAAEAAAGAGAGRWFFWKETFRAICERPFFGYGVEGITDRLFAASGGFNNRPHNEYLQYAAFFGVPALIAYLLGLLSVFVHALKNRAHIDIYSLTALCAAFAYLGSACFGNTMYYTAPYLFIFLALSFNVHDRSEQTPAVKTE